MIGRRLGVGVMFALGFPALALPQGVEIDHKAVGCIVAGKFPKMNACFTPTPSLARARVYFRPEGTPSWYYVDMKSDQPCFLGVLPRPSKKLVGKKVEYYVEAQDKSFNPARTAEYGPIVVNSAQECKKDVPVAPFLNNATVAVFPSVPAGFVGAGAISSAAVIGVVGAGAAAVGTAVVVASNSDDNDTTTTTAPIAVVTTTTTVPAATTTTTTTVPGPNNRPPFAVLTTNPDPPAGGSPLTVTFNMCNSSDPDGNPLSFFFDYGDGDQASGSCVETHTYTASSFRDVRASAVFTFSGSVVDPSGASASRSRQVSVNPPPPPTTTTPTTTLPCAPPTVAITNPTPPTCSSTTALPVSANATTANNVRFAADQIDCFSPITIATDVATLDVPGAGPTYSGTLNLPGSGCYRIKARADSSCSLAPATTSVLPVQVSGSGCSLPFSPSRQVATWSSDLTVEGGRLQVVVNGAAATFPGRGRSYGTAGLTTGQNRVEATVVEAAGRPGLWRFDIVSQQFNGSGRIQVFGGNVVAVGPNSVTFRLAGTPGERVAFTFGQN